MAEVGDLVRYLGPENLTSFELSHGAVGVITERFGESRRMWVARFFEQPGEVFHLHEVHDGAYWEVIPW